MGENDRAQDVGRRHRKAGQVAPATDEILERYRAAMRDELGGLLDELERPPAVQTSLDGGADRPVGLALAARRERWDLAIKLGKELAGGADLPPPGPAPAPTGRRGARQAPRLTAADRRALG